MHGWAWDSGEEETLSASLEAVARDDPDAPDDLWWAQEATPIRPKALAKIGRAVLRLRLYDG